MDTQRLAPGEMGELDELIKMGRGRKKERWGGEEEEGKTKQKERAAGSECGWRLIRR